MALHGDENYERKLRPLYDALDARSWKQAVKLADAALKKYKGDQLARALKGYALYHSGKPADSLQMMAEIVAEGPEAERVVMTMAYTYKAAGRAGDITQAYVAAANRQPRDPDIMLGLFKSHVRDFSFVRQQQVAARLSKLLPGGPASRCPWWMVCSLALQARAALLGQDERGMPLPIDGGGGLAADKLLALGETMAARAAAAALAAAPTAQGGADGAAQPAGVLSYEALLLWLDLLQGQGRAAEAAEAVEGPPGGAVPIAADRLQLRAAALARAGRLEAAAELYRSAVAAAPDDWRSWQLFLDCMLPGSRQEADAVTGRFPVGVVGGLAEAWDARQAAQRAQQAHSDPTAAAAALAAAEAAAEQLHAALAGDGTRQQALESGALRGPHLWRCELLLRRQRLAGAPPGEEEQLAMAAAVAEAFPRLAANSSCVPDLRPYLACLEGAAAEQLAASAHAAAADLNAADGDDGHGGSDGAGPEAGDARGAASGGDVGASNGSGAEAQAQGGGGGGVGAEARRLQRQVAAHQLELELGLPRWADADAAAAHAARLLRLYSTHMHLSAGLDEKERGHGEELVAGAVQTLVAAAVLEMGGGGDAADASAPPPPAAIGRLLQAALVLEAAQRRRKVSAPLRLAAAALYSLLGAQRMVAAQCTALDIKSIQHDSLTAHWLLPLLTGADDEAPLRRWVEGCAQLHSQQAADVGEALGTALEHGTYSKVAEFVDFKEQLQNSHGRALAAVARTHTVAAMAAAVSPQTAALLGGAVPGPAAGLTHAARLLEGGGSGGERAAADADADADAALGPRLRFNEDLSTRPSWFPPGPASGGAAVADWWRAAAAGRPHPGYARCWWAAPRAAESAAAEAAAWRRARRAELRVRLAWALAAVARLEVASDAYMPAEQMQLLLAGQEGQARDEGGSTGLQAAAARAVLAALQAVRGGDAAEGAAAVQQLGQACTAAGQRASAELAAAQHLPLLPGGVLFAAAAAAADCGAVATVCAKLATLAAGQAALAAAAGEAATAAASATSAVAAAAAGVAAAVSEERRVEGALELVGSCGGGEDGDLWGFEPGMDPRAALSALVAAQGAQLACMQVPAL